MDIPLILHWFAYWIDALLFNIDYELVNILFVKRDYDRFKECLDLIEPEANLYIADKADFDRFKDAAQAMKKFHNVINAAALVATMLDIIHFYFAERGKVETGDSRIPLAAIFGADSVPEGTAKVIKEAVKKMQEGGNVGEKNPWQVIEQTARSMTPEKPLASQL